MSIGVRAMTPADLEPVLEVLRAANLGGAVAGLARYLAWQPACGWVAIDAGAIVGSVTVLRQGAIGFVGCMAVAPERRGGGIGRLLLEHAHARARHDGVTTFLLEATPAGEVLYARLGYVVAAETVIATREPSGATSRGAIDDRAHVLALDREATGLDRADMIGGLLAERGPGLVVPRAGYGLVIGDRLGPVIARDAGAGRAIVEALAAPCVVVGAPAHDAALAALAANGFREARRLRRMYLGMPVNAPKDHVWALASPGAG